VATETTCGYALAEPAEAGVDPDRLDALLERARREIDDGLLPSCQLALARNGYLVLFETLGDADPCSRYVIFSATKGVIAGAVWILVGEEHLSWDTKIAEIVPEFGTNGKEVVTLEHLLTHTSGFPYAPMNFETAADRDSRLEKFSYWRLDWEPGTKFEYHPLSAHWVLAEVIERLSGMDYRKFIKDRIFDPLGLSAFALGEPSDRQGDINPLTLVGELPTPDEIAQVFGVEVDLSVVQGPVTDQALMELGKPEVLEIGLPGGGGISTAADIALYYQELLHNSRGIWKDDVIAEGIEVVSDLSDPIRGIPSHRSRGMMVAGDPPEAQYRGFGHGLSPSTFGHDGAGGQIAWADPDSGISFCYLTNGLDRHIIRQARRSVGLSSRAAACAASV
jgi:CubicO group peptidase (beta-lactamase class C family)